MTDLKKRLRQFLRQKRRDIDLAHWRAASNIVIKRVLQLPEFIQSRTIAAYLSQENEIDLFPLIQQALGMGKQVYLPVVSQSKRSEMHFHAYKKHEPLLPNRLNILEPLSASSVKIDAKNIDLFLMPLVGFDKLGFRLGRGGGYYDKTLSFCFKESFDPRPLLVGVAYEFQKIEAVASEKTDVPLDMVITEGDAYYFNQ